MVYVLDNHGKPLMPTERHGKVRHLLKQKKAKIVKRCPFTIQLLYDSEKFTQPISLGVDAGSKVIGLSATTSKKEVYAEEVELRKDVSKKMKNRKEFRASRRNRKTRYRKARFLNRVRTKKKGWVAPSIQNKIDTHLSVVSKVTEILPISNIVVETASFDIQKIKNPDISGVEYQQGEQLGFWNVREYVLHRDNHICQCCKCNSKKGDTDEIKRLRKILNVHHIESRKTGGDAPNNLITLCEYCHKQYHLGKLELPKEIERGKSFKDAAFMGIMRWAFYGKLKEMHPNVSMTYGYLTKNTRIINDLPKTHCVDARCISGNPTVKPLGYYYSSRKVRRHIRSLNKANPEKGGKRRSTISPYKIAGFRLHDKVKYKNKIAFISNRNHRGYFTLKTFDGEKLHSAAKSHMFQFIEPINGYKRDVVKLNC